MSDCLHDQELNRADDKSNDGHSYKQHNSACHNR